MTIHPLLAIIDAPIIIGILVVGALLFGADKLPKLARSAGQAKKEFLIGQAEADEAAAQGARGGAPARRRRHMPTSWTTSRPARSPAKRFRRRPRQGHAEFLNRRC